MADPLVVQSPRELRAETLGRIAAHEAQIARARHDLAHLTAALRLFTEPDEQRARSLVGHGFFKKGEIAGTCARHLDADGAMTTRELDITDATPRNPVVFKVAQALRHAERRRLARMVEKRKGVCARGPGDAVTLRVVAGIPSSPG